MAALWLSALPTPGPHGAALTGDAMRVAVRLWLGAPPRSDPPAARCRCGADADPEGRHLLGVCEELHGRRCALHLRIAHLVADAFTRSTSWMEVVLEAEFRPEDTYGLRPDVRAKRVSTGACAWADVSVASPFASWQLSRVAGEPLTPVAAIAREDKKVKKYVPSLPRAVPPSFFSPLVWETFGRVGPMTEAFLRASFAGPAERAVRAALQRDVSVAIWRANARRVALGYKNCFSVGGRAGGSATGRGDVGALVARIGE